MAQVGGEVVPGAAPPLQVLADFVIRVTPVSVTEAVIRQVGRSDKLLLRIVILLVAALAAATIGVTSGRGGVRRATVGIGLMATLPVLATTNTPGASPPGEFAVVAPAALLGAAVLWALATPLHGVDAEAANSVDGSAAAGALNPATPHQAAAEAGEAVDRSRTRIARRQLLRAALVLTGAATIGTTVTKSLRQPTRALMSRLRASLPTPRRALPRLTDELARYGASPLVTPNADLYRIDTALSPPLVDPDSWTLTVSRDGKRLAAFGYDELLTRATSESDVTIGCVSNEVGGDLIGTARWQGVLLSDLFAEIGVTRVGRVAGMSVDGFVASFPGELAFDGRSAMVAVGMNGVVLPVAHGFPARLVVPGLYGYTSATKWLQRIDVSDRTDLPGFWVDRGWAPAVTVHITSRIDAPHDHASISAGIVHVAGIAWAPVAGVGSVEVQVDDGPWQAARLSEFVTGSLWRQWVLNWQAPPGRHRIQVRAIDTRGRQQDSRRQPVFPSGATGLHRITVTVR